MQLPATQFGGLLLGMIFVMTPRRPRGPVAAVGLAPTRTILGLVARRRRVDPTRSDGPRHRRRHRRHYGTALARRRAGDRGGGHPGRAATLRARFGQEIIVVEADAGDLRLPTRPYFVVANPPFGVSAALLRRVLQPGSRLLGAHLILQAQVARRWAQTDAPGARRWNQDFRATAGRTVPRRAFNPRPRVDARVLAICRR